VFIIQATGLLWIHRSKYARSVSESFLTLSTADCGGPNGFGRPDVDAVGDLHFRRREASLLQDGAFPELAERHSTQPHPEQVLHESAETGQRRARLILATGGRSRGHYFPANHGATPGAVPVL